MRFLERLFGFAPSGYTYVCPVCLRCSVHRGYCLHDGAPLVLRPLPHCPNGHPQPTFRYNLVPDYCHECGALNRRP